MTESLSRAELIDTSTPGSASLLAVLTDAMLWDTPLRFRNISGCARVFSQCCSEMQWCDPSGIRTRVTAVRGQRTRPLYDGAVVDVLIEYATEVRADKNGAQNFFLGVRCVRHH